MKEASANELASAFDHSKAMDRLYGLSKSSAVRNGRHTFLVSAQVPEWKLWYEVFQEAVANGINASGTPNRRFIEPVMKELPIKVQHRFDPTVVQEFGNTLFLYHFL